MVHIIDLHTKCETLKKSAEAVIEYGALPGDIPDILADGVSLHNSTSNDVTVDEDAVGAAEDLSEYMHDLYWAVHELSMALAERDARRLRSLAA